MSWFSCLRHFIAAVAIVTLSGIGAFGEVFESGPVRPLALSPDGTRLLYVNTPDGRLEIMRVGAAGLQPEASVRVGLEPVAVAWRNDDEAWVVNHLSDSVSIVDLAGSAPSVTRTLLVGDEPQDIVFARGRAFVASARRGQHSPSDPAVTTPGIGRADVWVFDPEDPRSDLGGVPVAVHSLFGDSPRALTVSPDGARVFASVFKSGNQTSIVSAFAVCQGGSAAAPCTVDGRIMPGGPPPPSVNVEGIEAPRTGLIVQYDPVSGAWYDELQRDWRNAVDITLPDLDVFELDAAAATPRLLRAYSGVGTVLYGLAVHPRDGRVFVSATEAHNQVRFEPEVRGRLHTSRISILSPAGVSVRPLNKHIDYDVVPSPPGTAERSLALPQGMVFDREGERLYVAALGSDRVGVFDVAELTADTFIPGDPAPIAVTGGGPTGLAIDVERQRLYVATRFDNGVSEIDLTTQRELRHRRFHSPEPASVVRGRRWLYDARSTSSNGEVSCAGCHVFADTDDLAWDLGDPNAPVVLNPNPTHRVVLPSPFFRSLWTDFHPLKGPLTTQTLRGMDHHGPMHWRGDRSGAFLPGGDAEDERAAFRQFNGAFVSLLGGERGLGPEALEDLTDFVLAIRHGPNPHRRLDNRLTDAQEAARLQFFGPEGAPPDLIGERCVTCHEVDAVEGRFGTSLHMSSNGEASQLMKIPSLRTVYRKVGMFGLFPDSFRLGPGASGPQVRGFGFIHDGSLGMFISAAMEYVMAFDTDFAPVVGEQISVPPEADTLILERMQLLLERRTAGECEIVATAKLGNRERAWLITENGVASDRTGGDLGSVEALRQLAASEGATVTFTALPPGMGVRRGLDRDGDGVRDGDELAAGSDPADPASVAVPCVADCPCAGDCDDDGQVTVDEVITAVQMALGALALEECAAIDVNGDLVVTVDEIVRAVSVALDRCPTG